MTSRIGIDIGGTFTDAIVINEATGEIFIDKVTSTPRDPSIGFLQATNRILERNELDPSSIAYLVHGTTVATNAIIENTLARSAFITTDGFRDMLEIGRQNRPVLYDLGFEKLRPLVPRYLCFEIRERLDASGNVVVPIHVEDVKSVARKMKEEEVESIAVCLLHAHINPVHEVTVGEILRSMLPETAVSLSSEVAPEFREYFRASTTTINAGIRPVVSRYLESIESRLRAESMTGELLVMQSNGGLQTFEVAAEKPVFMVESGPAAGVMAATYLGESLGFSNMISLDMGGTTAKVGLILDGVPNVTKDYEVGATARPGMGSGRGSGYPIRTPVIDLVEIGAGGGSIAWVDSGGALRVGPRSAGADPGPACYGWGGLEPTVTDANLVLGRLNPEYFLGGEIKLDVERASEAIEGLASQLGMDLIDAAYGILEIANAAMVNALRLISIQRGYDPREFALVAFGGAGPLHSGRIAIELGFSHTIVPLSPGIFSALGLLVTDLKHDFSRTVLQNVERLDLTIIEGLFQELEEEGRDLLGREGVKEEDVQVRRYAEMRYVGQSYELSLDLPDGVLTHSDLGQILDQFAKEHDRVYGFSVPGEPVEIVNIRLSALGDIRKPRLREIGNSGTGSESAHKGARSVYFDESGGYIECPIFDRYKLAQGISLIGPAIIEEPDSTTVVHPGYSVNIDQYGNLLLTSDDG